jgi:glutamate dehydrogenase
MTWRLGRLRGDLVETVVSMALEHCGQSANLERFIRTYLDAVDPDDVYGREASDVCGAPVALWRFTQRREARQANVRMFNPDRERDGWRSSHTVVEVVTDDMPFLVDSLILLLNRHELGIHVAVHQIVRIRRDPGGGLTGVAEPGARDGGEPEALVHFEVDRVSERDRLDQLVAELREVLDDVRAAVRDWAAMRERVERTGEQLEQDPPPLDRDEVAEAAEFLRWLDDDRFTFLGSRDYELTRKNGTDVLSAVPGSGLGILREDAADAPRRKSLSGEAARVAREPSLLILTKTNARATVHGGGRMDYVGVKFFDAEGTVIGERRFVGLYGRRVYRMSCFEIPMLRSKMRAALDEVGFPPGSHSEKALAEMLDTAPRDLAFQTPKKLINEFAHLTSDLVARGRVRLYPFREIFRRFYNCWVYLPSERYNRTVRTRIERILCEALGGTEVEHSVRLGGSTMAGVLFVVWLPPDANPKLDVGKLEAELARASRPWELELRNALIERYGEERGPRRHARYRDAFPISYQEAFSARAAVADIERMQRLDSDTALGMTLYRPDTGPDGTTRFKILRAGAPMSLSETLPLLENLGVWVLDERPFAVTPREGDPVWIYDFGLKLPEDVKPDREGAFQEAFAQAWRGATENDGFNRLVLLAGLDWREVVVLRAIWKYLRQTGSPFSQAYIQDCLTRNPSIAAHLVGLFAARFDPEHRRDPESLVKQLEAELDAVESLDEDRILGRFLGAIQAMLRTNHFQSDDSDGGVPKPYLSFKVAPSQVPDMPLPHPAFEIFVYSPHVEGVHLRGGAIARGGLRWSDRMEDFRTEILGLMKAQHVKNAVIVPTGAKGGFVVKRPTAGMDRGELREEGVRCYTTFISGLLDITDNLDGEVVVPPPNVVRYDEDDTYLVVAADKGTATFSDIANDISVRRGFWLGDAFASGGSSGYDHKKMAITARGAWESVKRHFRQFDVDVARDEFTVAGIGDMSGDVFGNGMLLSEGIRLVAAFDHRHIFLDPGADAATGFAERRRLFELSGSSWADYDESRISPGGGVFPRTHKSIRLSEQVQALLEVDADRMAPSDLIKAILRAPVDLLWNGGVGTYVKATDERDTDADDRTNDGVRVDAAQLRCRVIGEGGNLGLTQRARVEYARGGGLVNTDAVDNSAGVDCSDHEVNIKILLSQVVADGELTTEQRDELLKEMTDEVTELVLDDNREQTLALANSLWQAGPMRDVHARYIRYLEDHQVLDRQLEYLPADEELAEHGAAEGGLVAPESAVLLAYTKLMVYGAILDSEIPDDPYLQDVVSAYFPTQVRERFSSRLPDHPLRRQIIANRVANNSVNRAGTSCVFRMIEETGQSVCEVVRRLVTATDMFDATTLWNEILTSGQQLNARTLTGLLLDLRKLVERGTRWLLRNADVPMDLEETVSMFAPGLRTVARRLPELLAERGRAEHESRAGALREDGVPDGLADTVAGFDHLFSGLDIVHAAQRLDRSVEECATTYFELGEQLQIDWIRKRINALPRGDRWSNQARIGLREALYREHIVLTGKVLRTTGRDDSNPPPRAWLRDRESAVERYHALLRDLKDRPASDITTVSVGLCELHNLA